MNKFFDDGVKFFWTCSWKDIGIFKLCLVALGMVLGMSIPEKRRNLPLLLAAGAFTATYIPLMARFIKFSRNRPEE